VPLLTFEGASDDLVEINGDVVGADEYSVNPKGPHGYAGTWHVGGQMRVHAFFGLGGVWYFAPALISEGHPLPLWAITITNSELARYRCYSTKLMIDVPAGTYVSKEDTGEDR
jgi:hypothetical protein